MAGIFKNLFDLKIRTSNQPKEDYLTELFAYVLSQNFEILKDFLKHFDIYSFDIEEYLLTTQLQLRKLESHSQDSRPDMALFLNDNDVIMYFENKIDAKEGDNQLPRYAEHLDQTSSLIKVLIYITRDYDNKEKKELFKNTTSKIEFVVIRWYQIFHFLLKHKNDLLVLELIKFMKQLNLSMNNQFTPIDLLTLSNFSKVRKMLDESMYGQVSEKFQQINHGISKKSASMTQLKDKDRYLYYRAHHQTMWVWLGFWMNSNTEKEYPEVGIVIEVAPNSDKRKEIIKIFSEIEANNKDYKDWEGVNLNYSSKWASVGVRKSLQQYLSFPNQIQKIKDFYLFYLDELENMFNEYPQLPVSKKE